tara:strand:- start:127 stop:528 length:402 start_codon:yes stop_codon:yes gene_type:complete
MIRLFKQFAWISAVLLAGCQQGEVPITGVITLDGVPLGNAQVMFKPDGEVDAKTVMTGSSDASGQFSFIASDIPAGNYRVLVFKMMEIGAAGNIDGNELSIPVPEKYSDEETSPLTVEFPAKTEIRLELQNEN